MPKYYEDFQLYNQPQEVRSDCNSLTVVNIGTAIAVINGLQILPTEQYIILGNENEYNVSRYRLAFSGAGTQEVIVIRKIYI